MERNKYAGYCYCCGKWIEPRFGHLERYKGERVIKCANCRTVRDVDREVVRIRKAVMENGRKEM